MSNQFKWETIKMFYKMQLMDHIRVPPDLFGSMRLLLKISMAGEPQVVGQE